VLNSSEGVVVEVEGEEAGVQAFLRNLEPQAPPRASVEKVTVEEVSPCGEDGFVIRPSREKEGEFLLISPDIGTCEQCRNELFDPQDRRYRYPFTNCTNCGPRFTIIEDIPYDRPKTTMRKFQMCSRCQREYDDPRNRRFHAQPNACSECGPKLKILSLDQSEGNGRRFKAVNTSDPIGEAIRALRAGEIVAIKGLGGFHLACDALNESAVRKLRERKRRFGKPLAIMLSDLEQVRKFCHLSSEESEALRRPERPIILLRSRTEGPVAPSVAPNNDYLGVMLPYTPLHHILLEESGMALVMTSGNISEEPIAMENEEALRRLGHIADHFLLHNRDIYSRYDDSVARVFEGKLAMLRRARSFAPYPLHLPFKAPQILACGPELKNTFCLTRDEYAFVSQHVGDMENAETMEHFENTLALYRRLFRINPEIVAYDLHPEYLATKYAKALSGVELVGVQHHHAHVVSVMAENGIRERIIGIAFDGTGYGTDGNIWGGEFLVADWRSFRRVGNLRLLPMPGGAAAINRPYRMAFGYLYSFWGEEALAKKLHLWKRIPAQEIAVMIRQLERRLNSPLTSSCGRLFDAVSAILGVRDTVHYEGQAAIELEMLADERETGVYAFSLGSDEEGDSLVVDTEPVMQAIIADLEMGVPVTIISARFHNTVCLFSLEVCRMIRERESLSRVALSGGVFQNLYLLSRLKRNLEEEGFEVFINREVPTNDGGVSLGQAVVAYASLAQRR
jgi:hydrogenase maturation protein HypF